MVNDSARKDDADGGSCGDNDDGDGYGSEGNDNNGDNGGGDGYGGEGHDIDGDNGDDYNDVHGSS